MTPIQKEISVGEAFNFTILLRDNYNNSACPFDSDFLDDMLVVLSGQVLLGGKLWTVEEDITKNVELHCAPAGGETTVFGFYLPTTASLMYWSDSGAVVANPDLAHFGFVGEPPV
jgi:hypothetical protein